VSIWWTHFGDCCLHRGFDRLLVRRVDRFGANAAPGRLKFLAGRVELIWIGAPDHHVRASLRQSFGHAEPDPAIAAGDQRDLAGQVERRISHGGLSQLLFNRSIKRSGKRVQ